MTPHKLRKAFGAAALTVAMSTSIALADTPFRDVPTNHWAYAAIGQLQADGLIEGYPGGYFKGDRPLTRYELAVAVARLDQNVKDKLAALQTVTPADLETLRKLEDEFRAELDDVKKDLASVKSDVATLKTQVAAEQATLDRQKLKLSYFVRSPGTFRDYVAGYAVNPDGSLNLAAALPANTSIIGPSNGGGFQALKTGEAGYGTGFGLLRLRFDGVVDPKVSYSVRIEDIYFPSNAPGNGAQGTSSTLPAFGSIPNNGGLRLNWAHLTYKDPSGLYATVGRFCEISGDIGLDFANYYNGAELGYAKGKLLGFAGYGFNKASASNRAGLATAGSNPQDLPVAADASQTLFARVQYAAAKRLMLGANWANALDSWYGLSAYNPNAVDAAGNAGLVQPYNKNIATGSVDAIYQVAPKFTLEGEALQRFGKDPFTQSNWDGRNASWLKAYLGDRDPKSGNSYADAGFVSAGLNSTAASEVQGVVDYQQFYIANPNGYQIGYIGVHRFIGAGTQIGLIYQGYRLKRDLHVDYLTPAGYLNGVLHKDDGRALFLETKLVF
jgi:hypothetical protein